MNEKMREEFEEWLKARYWGEGLGRFDDGEYHKTSIQYMWESWQASRAALVVELPGKLNAPPYASYEGGWNDMRIEALDALADAGVTARMRTGP